MAPLNYYVFCHHLNVDLTPLDWSILNLLIERAESARGHGFGRTARWITRTLEKRLELDGRKNSALKTRDLLQHLRGLERLGLVYSIKFSRARWFPSSRVMAASGFARGTQRNLEDFL